MTACSTKPVRHTFPATTAGFTLDYEVVYHRFTSWTGRGDGGVFREGFSSRIIRKLSCSTVGYVDLGTWTSGSVIGNGVALIFPAKYLVDHVDEST